MHLGDFEQLLLFAVLRLDEEAHGAAICEELEARAGRVVSPGAAYTALDRLEQRGFVTSWIGEGTPARGGRRRRYYRILPEGARALRASYDTVRHMAAGLGARMDALAERSS